MQPITALLPWSARGHYFAGILEGAFIPIIYIRALCKYINKLYILNIFRLKSNDTMASRGRLIVELSKFKRKMEETSHFPECKKRLFENDSSTDSTGKHLIFF